MPVGKCSKCGGPIYKSKAGAWTHLKGGKGHKATR